MLTEPCAQRPSPAAARVGPPRREAGAVGPELWLLVTLTAIAALLRFWTLTSQSFWVDEATTVHEVGLSFGAMLHAITQHESTPPLYFALAWVWTRVFGAGELGIRSLSALLGTVTVPVVYLCARELVSRRAGLVAGAFAAVSPFLIWYSQEARCYILLALLSGLSLLFTARAGRTRHRAELALWAATSSLALLTHFFAGFLVVPEALWLLWRLRSRGAILACAAVAAVAAALVPLAVSDASHPLSQWIGGLPRGERIRAVPTDFAVSQLYRSSALDWGLRGAAVLFVVVAVLLWWGGGRRERRGALAAAVLAACVILVPIGLAELGHDYVFSRNFMPAWIPLAVVLAAACTASRTRVAGGLLAAVVVGGFLWAGAEIAGNPRYQRPDWRGVAAALGVPSGARAIVAYDGNAAEPPLAVYLRGAQFTYSGMPPGNRPTTVTELDVVGDVQQSVSRRLPPGARLISTGTVESYRVARFALTPAWRLRPSELAARAPSLLGPASASGASVLVQR